MVLDKIKISLEPLKSVYKNLSGHGFVFSNQTSKGQFLSQHKDLSPLVSLKLLSDQNQQTSHKQTGDAFMIQFVYNLFTPIVIFLCR